MDEIFRSTFFTGLTAEDYLGTIRILQRMVENLARDAGQPPRTEPADV